MKKLFFLLCLLFISHYWRIIMKKTRLLSAVCACVILFASTLSNAATVGVTISGPGTQVWPGNSWNLGYSFTVNSPTDIVSLGVWDYLGDGLTYSHMWDSGTSIRTSWQTQLFRLVSLAFQTQASGSRIQIQYHSRSGRLITSRRLTVHGPMITGLESPQCLPRHSR